MNIQDKIELYLENKLSPGERKIFENEILINEDLAREVSRRKSVNILLKKLLRYPGSNVDSDKNFNLSKIQNIEIEEDIIKYSKEYDNKNDKGEEKLKKLLEKKKINPVKNNGNQFRLIVRVAAGFILATFFTFSIIYHIKSGEREDFTFTNQTICEKFPSNKDPLLRSLINSAMLFRQSELNQLEYISPAKSDSINKSSQVLKLSDAVNSLENSNLSDARHQFEALIKSEFDDINAAMLWYYSLLCIREENLQEAISALRELKAGRNFYSYKAKKVLKKISK